MCMPEYNMVLEGNIVTVAGVDYASIGITDGIITAVSDKGLRGKKTITLGKSSLIFPGFIDPHVHLREPGWEYKEDFLSGSRAALHSGVTTVGDMPNLPVPVTSRAVLARKQKLAKRALVDVLHYGAAGSEADIRALAPHVPAFKIYTAQSTGDLMTASPEAATRLIASYKKPVIFHCEDQNVIEKATAALAAQKYAWKHCDERPPEAEIAAVGQVIELCKKYEAAGHIAHISTAKAVTMVNEAGMSCEVTPHHLFFRKEDMQVQGALLKMNPPLRSEAERRALLRAVKKGRISMLATDHAPHTLQEKLVQVPSGVPGLDTYGNFVLWLMREHSVKPELLAVMTSHHAARFLGLADRGVIKKGCKADLAILDRKGRTTIENKKLYTKCGWSPFNGMAFPGRILYTIRDGRAVTEKGKVTA